MTVLAGPCRDKKAPLPNLEEELMLKARNLLKDQEESGFFPPPHFSFDYKTVAHEVIRVRHPLTRPRVSLTSALF